MKYCQLLFDGRAFDIVDQSLDPRNPVELPKPVDLYDANFALALPRPLGLFRFVFNPQLDHLAQFALFYRVPKQERDGTVLLTLRRLPRRQTLIFTEQCNSHKPGALTRGEGRRQRHHKGPPVRHVDRGRTLTPSSTKYTLRPS